jgi:FAD/FMN-containing dehydrogenase
VTSVERITRRVALSVGAAGALSVALAACTPTKPGPTTGPTHTPAAPPPWSSLASKVKGPLALPGQADYGQVKLTENPIYDSAEPLAVLTASSAQDVAAALAFAHTYRVPLAMRAGGHSYPGWSSGGAPGTGMPSSLVIDTRGMSGVSVATDGTATVGAGASLAQVYSTLGGAGRAIGAGSCATVGAAGLTLGGGVGVLTRAYGLACDQVQSFQIVTADGRIRTASSSSNPDLFWACRGGGGGHLGVVTSITYRTVAAPTVTTFYYSWPFSAAASVVAAWQSWMPSTDPQLWTTLKLLGGQVHSSGPAISMSGTWIGAPAALSAQLASLFSRIGAALTAQSVATKSYLNAMMGYAGCANVPIAQCQTGPGGALTREPFANTSHIGTTALSSAGIGALIAQVQGAQGVSGMTEGGISMDALGGVVSQVSADDSAFFYRNAPMTIQYTSTFQTGASPDPYWSYVRGFRQAMTPYWGNTAYVNYSDATLTDAPTAYFGSNASRLARIRRTYDPQGLFTQPQSY